MKLRTLRLALIASAASLALASAFAGTQDGRAAADASRAEAPAYRLIASDTRADDYRKQAGAKVDEWKQKVEAFSSKAKEQGTAAGKAAAEKLDSAWDGVKTQWGKLQNATDDGWDDAKDAFEKAWRNFEDAWKSASSRS